MSLDTYKKISLKDLSNAIETATDKIMSDIKEEISKCVENNHDPKEFTVTNSGKGLSFASHVNVDCDTLDKKLSSYKNHQSNHLYS
ncbi:MAG: hypothetical protein OCD00_19420 [Colwellia sp.]